MSEYAHTINKATPALYLMGITTSASHGRASVLLPPPIQEIIIQGVTPFVTSAERTFRARFGLLPVPASDLL